MIDDRMDIYVPRDPRRRKRGALSGRLLCDVLITVIPSGTRWKTSASYFFFTSAIFFFSFSPHLDDHHTPDDEEKEEKKISLYFYFIFFTYSARFWVCAVTQDERKTGANGGRICGQPNSPFLFFFLIFWSKNKRRISRMRGKFSDFSKIIFFNFYESREFRFRRLCIYKSEL